MSRLFWHVFDFWAATDLRIDFTVVVVIVDKTFTYQLQTYER